jgi:hypothetical protein
MDLDQGSSTIRFQWGSAYYGPTVGWVAYPVQNLLPITAAGSYVLDPAINVVEVSVAGSVTITLPPASNPGVPAGAMPGRYVNNPITIVDVGGNAATNNIVINPAVGETVMGLASIKIQTNYGGFSLLPVSAARTWTSISP